MRDEPADGDKALPLKRRSALFDVVAGITFSQIVAFAIMISTADTLGSRHTPIASAAEAASALRPFAGRFAEHIFGLGFIGSGMLAIAVLVGSASIGISGLPGKEWGFSRPYREAPFSYWLIIGGTVLATILIAADARLISGMPMSRGMRFGGWLTAGVMGAAAVSFFALLFV